MAGALAAADEILNLDDACHDETQLNNMQSSLEVDRNGRSNDGHETDNLLKWYENYLKDEHAFVFRGPSATAEVDSDYFDEASLEAEIATAVLGLEMTDGFCARCISLFNNWPDSMTSGGVFVPDAASYTLSEILAAALKGCQCCGMRAQELKKRQRRMYKLECRLKRLNRPMRMTAMLYNPPGEDGGDVVLALESPGRKPRQYWDIFITLYSIKSSDVLSSSKYAAQCCDSLWKTY